SPGSEVGNSFLSIRKPRFRGRFIWKPEEDTRITGIVRSFTTASGQILSKEVGIGRLSIWSIGKDVPGVLQIIRRETGFTEANVVINMWNSTVWLGADDPGTQ